MLFSRQSSINVKDNASLFFYALILHICIASEARVLETMLAAIGAIGFGFTTTYNGL